MANQVYKSSSDGVFKRSAMLEQKSLLRTILLHLIAILFVIFNISDIRISGLSNIVPLLDLMMIFYFAIFKRVFAVWFIFVLGIWNDALNGNPLGVTPLCYILLIESFLVINNRMLPKEEFQQVWQQFVIFCFLFLAMKWAILSIFAVSFFDFKTPLIHLVLSSVLYVLMHRFFDYLSQKLLQEN